MAFAKAKEALGSTYLRAVATLATGQTLAAIIPILAAPILGRLYLPSDYGILAIYMAIASVLSAMSTLQYAQAIIAERNDQRAIELVRICFLATAGMSILGLLAGIVGFMLMGGGGTYESARTWMLLLPATTLAAGLSTAIATLANRFQRYRFMAKIQVVSVAVTVSTSILLGFQGFGVDGLFIAYILGQFINTVSHLWLYRKVVPKPVIMKGKKIFGLAHRHRRFPIYTMPSELVSTINLQLPVFALGFVGAVALVGSFTRARQLVSMPITLLGSSIGQVFRQRASKDYHEYGSCRPIFKRTFIALLLIGIPPTVILMVVAPDLFRLFLGPNWGEAGEVASILAPMLLLRLICSPLSTVFYFTGAQRVDFILSLLGAVIGGCAMLLPIIIGAEPINIVYGFTITYVFIYICYIALSWKLSNKK